MRVVDERDCTGKNRREGKPVTADSYADGNQRGDQPLCFDQRLLQFGFSFFSFGIEYIDDAG